MGIKSMKIKRKNYKNSTKYKSKKLFKIYYKSRLILIDRLD